MQAFANVATAPVRKTTQSGGKAYWEFRAAESAKNEEKSAATWYTVRVFQEDDPGFSKGDFVRLVGKLKLDVFMSREGKPMGVLVVMCYEARRYEKPPTRKASCASAVSAPSSGTCTDMAVPPREPNKATEAPEDVPDDERWLALVG